MMIPMNNRTPRARHIALPCLRPCVLAVLSLVSAQVAHAQSFAEPVLLAQNALTDKGAELWEVVETLSRWGMKWIGELGDTDLDPHLLFWDMRRKLDVDAWPRSRTTVAFDFSDVTGKAGRWWLVVNSDDVEVCDFDPGYDLDAAVQTDLRTLTQLWRGDADWASALATERITIVADTTVRRQLPTWIGQGQMAAVPRAFAGVSAAQG